LSGPRVLLGGAAAPETLAASLEAVSIPSVIEGNYGTTDAIRRDSSFDHLSLLSVRQPDRFAELVASAQQCEGRVARRIGAHGRYIQQNFAAAADIYAELLLDDVGDLDLWRDYCWALRHAGAEQPTRCWVMHPAETVGVASAVGFDRTQARPHRINNGTGPSDLVKSFLEWVSDDLG
jgi:hypothetical protein